MRITDIKRDVEYAIGNPLVVRGDNAHRAHRARVVDFTTTKPTLVKVGGRRGVLVRYLKPLTGEEVPGPDRIVEPSWVLRTWQAHLPLREESLARDRAKRQAIEDRAARADKVHATLKALGVETRRNYHVDSCLEEVEGLIAWIKHRGRVLAEIVDLCHGPAATRAELARAIEESANAGLANKVPAREVSGA